MQYTSRYTTVQSYHEDLRENIFLEDFNTNILDGLKKKWRSLTRDVCGELVTYVICVVHERSNLFLFVRFSGSKLKVCVFY